MYDTRSFDRVEQIQHSLTDIELLDAEGNVQTTHRSEVQIRWIYKAEMALLLRAAGFSRWEICGDFDRRPLTQETDGMVVLAWRDE
jgi:sulfite reductase beta subunit-like hemoprotein